MRKSGVLYKIGSLSSDAPHESFSDRQLLTTAGSAVSRRQKLQRRRMSQWELIVVTVLLILARAQSHHCCLTNNTLHSLFPMDPAQTEQEQLLLAKWLYIIFIYLLIFWLWNVLNILIAQNVIMASFEHLKWFIRLNVSQKIEIMKHHPSNMTFRKYWPQMWLNSNDDVKCFSCWHIDSHTLWLQVSPS